MLTNGIVSIFAYDKEADDYTLSGIFNAWVHNIKRVKTNKAGASDGSSLSCRIPISKSAVPSICEGDFLMPFVTSVVDMSKALKITEIAVNTFGANPHIRIKAGE